MTKVLTEREIVTELLQQLKNSPCLWDPTHKFYYNKDVRNQHYEMMLENYQQMEPEGTVQTLKKKIEHFRAAYRRERKKVENSTVTGSSNKVHTPNLWYYNLMTFLNVKAENSSDEDDEKRSHQTQPTKKRKTSPAAAVDIIKKEEIGEPLGESYSAKWDAPDYITAFGESIAKQLKELDEPVRYEAERIISDVIYRARTGTLPKYSPEAVDTIIIPQLGPSWYDVPIEEDQKAADCLVVCLADEVNQQESDDLT